ncbi:RHS repeat-associated core domain-containing protein, partial [Streptomyces wedmorensis]
MSPTGAFSYAIPLDVPAGRAGVQPSLSLGYSSGGGNGVLGVGWALNGGMSTVTRCGSTLATETRTAGVKFDEWDRFCLDGQKLMGVGGVNNAAGTYGGNDTQYRTETDSFAQIVSNGGSVSEGPDTFTVRTKDGRIRTYVYHVGEPVKASEVSWDNNQFTNQVTNSSAKRSAWLLEREKDRSGNEMRYKYQVLQGNEILLDRIEYTFHTDGQADDLDAKRSVRFTYENRTDAGFTYSAGKRFDHTKRLKTIAMWAPNPDATKLAWQYNLTYDLAPAQRSLLASVAKCSPSGACVRAKEFIWNTAGRAAVPKFTESDLGGFPLNTGGVRSPQLLVTDFTGDGADDALYTLGGTEWTQDSSGYHASDAPYYLVRGVRNGANGSVWPLNAHTKVEGQQGSAWPQAVLGGLTRVADLNGDGKAELVVRHDKLDSEGSSLIDTSLTWDGYKFVSPGGAWGSDFGGWNGLTDLADMDGNGLADQVKPSGVSPYAQRYYGVRLNGSGQGLSPVMSSTLLGPLNEVPLAAPECAPVVTDTEGDGRADLIMREAKPNLGSVCKSNQLRLRLNSANQPEVDTVAWESGGVMHYRAVPIMEGFAPKGGDFNGDGLQDVLMLPVKIDPATQTWDREAALLWNTGNGLVADSHTPVIAHDKHGDVRVADINGDGRDDLVALNTATHVMISNGNGEFFEDTIAADSGTVTTKGGRGTTQLGDFNADGRPDLVRVHGNHLKLLTNAELPGDLITAVRDQDTSFDREQVSYSQAWTDHQEKLDDYACEYPLVCNRSGMTVVRSLSSTPADPAQKHTLEYSYEDPVANLTGRGFLGFGTLRIWDKQRPAETVYTFPHRLKDTQGGTYYPYVNTPSMVTTTVPILTQAQVNGRDGLAVPNTATARITRSYFTDEVRRTNHVHISSQSPGLPTYSVVPKSSYTKEWEEPVDITWGSLVGTTHTEHLDNITEPVNPLRRTDTTAAFDAYGNQTNSYRATGVGVTEWVATTFDNRETDWLIGLPTKTTVTRAEADADPGPVTRTVENHYDSLGRLDTVWIEKDAASDDVKQTSTYSYNAYGLPTGTTTSAKDLWSRETHYEYAPMLPGQPDEHMYASQVWNTHAQANTVPAAWHQPSQWTAIHPAYGVVVAGMDANGVQTSTVHDDLGRPVTVNTDGADATTLTYANQPHPAGGTAGTKVTSVTGPTTAKVISDAAGRTVSTGATGFDGQIHATTTGYDLLGRATTITTPAPGGTTTTSYDSLDRPLTAVAPDGKTTTQAHTFFTTTTTDPTGAKAETTRDVDGRTTKTVGFDNTTNPATPVTSRFEYGPFDVLTKSLDDANNATTYEWDVRGRQTKITEPDRGTSTTAYYGTGDVRTTTHLASGDSVTLFYDDLGRSDKKTSPDGVYTYTFDTAAHGIGKPATATSPDKITTAYRYDAHGRTVGTDYTDASVSPAAAYHVDQTYDTHGRLESVQYPEVPGRTRFTLTNGYNQYGHLNTVTDTSPGQNPKTLYTVTDRTDSQALKAARLGDAAGTTAPTLTHTYDSPTGRLHNTTVTNSASADLQNLTYTYRDNGQLERRTDTVNNRTEDYTYDTLGRLKTWALTHGNNQPKTTGYGYDTIDNLTTITVNGTTDTTYGYGKPDHTQPHTQTTTTPAGQSAQNTTHDNRGRLTAGHGRTLTYTAFDLPKTITKAGDTITYLYDAHGTKIKETSTNGTSTLYIPGLFEHRTSGGNATDVFHLPGIGQAVYNGTTTTVEYALTDHQGSTTATTNHNGTTTTHNFYDPYGNRTTAGGTPAAPTGDVTRGYTGHEHDDQAGLINMKGRVYDAAHHTFLTPDPLNTTTHNPYSYTHHDPVNRTDPSGYKDGAGNTPGWIGDFYALSNSYWMDGVAGLYNAGGRQLFDHAAAWENQLADHINQL